MLYSLLNLAVVAYVWLGRGFLVDLRELQKFLCDYERLIKDGWPPLRLFKQILSHAKLRAMPMFAVLEQDALAWGKALPKLAHFSELMRLHIQLATSARALQIQWFVRATIMHLLVLSLTVLDVLGNETRVLAVSGPVILAMGLQFCLSYLLLGRPERPWLLRAECRSLITELLEMDPSFFSMHATMIEIESLKLLHRRRLDLVPVAELFGLGLIALLLLAA